MFWPSIWKSLSVTEPEFWALNGHLTWLRLQKGNKSSSIYDAGWSSLVARRAHNPKVVGSNPTPATKLNPPVLLHVRSILNHDSYLLTLVSDFHRYRMASRHVYPSDDSQHRRIRF